MSPVYRFGSSVIALLALLLAIVFAPVPASALPAFPFAASSVLNPDIDAPPPSTGGEGEVGNVKSTCEAIRTQIIEQDKDKAYIVEYIVACTTFVVEQAFEKFITEFYTAVESAIGAALTLSVVLFGVLVAIGALEKPTRDTFVALFKLACVLYFVQPEIVRDQLFLPGLGAMQQLTDWVYQFGDGSNGERCFDNDTLWDKLDCTLDILIGTVKEPEGGATLTGVSRGMMHFFAASFTSTSLGAIIAMLGMYVTYTILFAIIKSIHTYLAAIIALAFILMIAPFFVPMIMFKVTRTYFDKWMRIAMSFVLQPVILFGFLSVMMIVMHGMLFQTDGSFMKTVMGDGADQQPTSNNAFISQALEDQGVYGTKLFARLFDKNDSSERDGSVEDTGFTTRRVTNSSADPDEMYNDTSFGKMGMEWDKVQFEKLSECGSGAECQKKIAMSVLTLALTAFVFTSMLNYIPNLATDLSGGVYEVPSLFNEVGAKLPGGAQLDKLVRGGSNQLTETLRGHSSRFRDQLGSVLGVRR